MNPWFILACGLGQLALLHQQAPWTSAVAFGAGLLAILGAFAFTRLRWDSHLDMILSMAGPGGFGMLLAQGGGPACHASMVNMTLGMLALTVPFCWTQARCLREARREGRGLQVLAADLVGMQAGMMLGHLPAQWIPASDARLAWLHHGSMLAGMLLGMTASMFAIAYFRKQEIA